MSEHKEPIPSMIYNAAVGGHVTNSQQIIDENENKEQSQINAEIKQIIGQEGSVDSRIAAAVNIEKTRAQAAEQLLQEQYDALTQSDIVIGAIPESGTKNIIYRVPGTNSYSDYMWDGTQFVKMAEYNNAIDDVPTAGSDNLVKSGGVYDKTNNSPLVDYVLLNDFANSAENIKRYQNIIKSGKTYKIKIDGQSIVDKSPSGYSQYCNIAFIDSNNNRTALIEYKKGETFEPKEIEYVADKDGSLEFYSYVDGVVSLYYKDCDILSYLDERVDKVYPEIIKDEVIRTLDYPQNTEGSIFDSIVFPAGKYKFRLKGNGTVHPSAATWTNWLGILIADANDTVLETLYLLPRNKLFEEITITHIFNVPFKLCIWAYYTGHIYVELLQEGSIINKIMNEISSVENAKAFFIEHDDIVTTRTPLSSTWDTGYGIDKENMKVVQNAGYNTTHDYINVPSGGIYSVENNGNRISDMEILYFNSSHQGVHVDDTEYYTGNNGKTYTIHQRINGYVILKQEIVDKYNIAYMKIAVPSAYTITNIGIYRFSRASLIPSKQELFNKISGNGKIIKMSWFNRRANYSDSQILNDMYALAAMGATLYLDNGNITLDRRFETNKDGLGKSISIISENGTQVIASNSFVANFLLYYVMSEQTLNAYVYDENGNIMDAKPIIKGLTFECLNKCGGLYSTKSRGLLIEDNLIHNASTFAIKLDKSTNGGYEFFVNKCRIIYDLNYARENIAIGGSANDSSFSNIIIIGYNKGIMLSGDSNVYYNIHGWIGWNAEHQIPNSEFMTVNGMVESCYADTYVYGFTMNIGTISSCQRFSNPIFYNLPPENRFSNSVKQIGNIWQ